MSEEFTDGNLTDEEFTDEPIITGRIKEAPMTPVDILLGPTLLFDVVPLSIWGTTVSQARSQSPLVDASVTRRLRCASPDVGISFFGKGSF